MSGNTTRNLSALAFTLATACGAQAQAIYRCGDSYSPQPCAGGKAIDAAAPAPTAGERAGAAAAARRDAALAGTLEKERLRQEAQPAAAYIPPPRMEPEAGAVQRQGPDKSATRRLDRFTAVTPGGRSAADGKPPAAKGKPKKKEAQEAKSPARPLQAKAAVRTTNAGPQPPAR